MKQLRVVITGIGVVTPIGTGRERFWTNLLAGRSGIGPVKSFDTSAYSVHRGAEVHDFEVETYLSNLDAAHLGRASQFAIAAARLALADANVEIASLDLERAGVSMGTTSGEPREVERFDDLFVGKKLGRVGPEFLALYPSHVIAAHIARELRFSGINIMIPTACAAGNYAIAHAFDVLRNGRADLMLAGGSDSFSRITYTGFAQLGAIAPEVCQPFDRHRKGMIPGEGAGVLVLEPLSSATRRGARIYAEISGYGLSCDAHHMTAAHPNGEGAARAMQQALAQSSISPQDVSYISAHGTGTPTNDRLETLAVKRVFGDAAYSIPMSSIKSMLGHTMGAASAIEAAACTLAVYHDRIPPTINLKEPDPECDLDYVPDLGRKKSVEHAVCNCIAFGSKNSALVLRNCA